MKIKVHNHNLGLGLVFVLFIKDSKVALAP